MMGPGGQYRANSMPQVYKHYIDGGGTGTGAPQRRFKNLEDIVCFKVRWSELSILGLKSPGNIFLFLVAHLSLLSWAVEFL